MTLHSPGLSHWPGRAALPPPPCSDPVQRNAPAAWLHPNTEIFGIIHILCALKLCTVYFFHLVFAWFYLEIRCMQHATECVKVSEGSKCTMQYYNIALCYANYSFPAAPAMSARATYQTGTKPPGELAAARSLTSEPEGLWLPLLQHLQTKQR